MIIRAGSIALALSLTLGCGGATPSSPEGAAPPPAATPEPAKAPQPAKVSETRPHVVMVTLDTFRGDRLGANGYDKARTETLDALANAGTRFSQAYSPLPLTIPAHSTMFTGKYPPTLGIRSNGSGKLEEEQLTLAEILQGEGYATAGSVAAYVTTRGWGFSQGFDAYFDDIPAAKDDNFWHGERPGEKVIDDILGWKKEQSGEQAQFIWVHLYDAHFPFQPSEEYLEASEGRPYDAEIAYVDDQIQRIVDAYEGTPTLFVFAGDHGEGLGDHRELAHGMFAYNATQHVPMFFSGTGVDKKVVDAPVSLADLMPTVLDMLSIEAPEGMEGRVVGKADDVPVYMETYQLSERFKLAPQVAVVDGTWKYIDNPKPELYDLSADMGEKKNLASAHPDEVERLRKVITEMAFEPPGSDKATLDPEVASQLAALGYTDGGEMPDFNSDLPDHKDHAKLIRLSQKAEREQMGRKMDEALATLEELSELYPEVVEFRTRRAMLLRRMKRPEEARAAIAAALELAPDNPNIRLMFAGNLAEEGKFEEAARTFREVAEEVPYIPRVRSLALMAMRNTSSSEAVFDLGNRWVKEYPEDYNLAGSFGVVNIEAKKYDRGLELLALGLKADKPESDVRFYLAARKMGSDLEAARALLEGEVADHPGNVRASAALLKLYIRVQAWEEQLKLADRLIGINKDDVISHHGKVLALFNQDRFLEARAALTTALEVDPEHPDLVLMDANLLAKEGKMEEGKKRFEEAKAIREARHDKVREAIEAGKMPPIPGVDAKPKATPSADNPFGVPSISFEEIFAEANGTKAPPPATPAP